MSSDAHLYGNRAPKNTVKPISSSTSLAFTSTLTSLISNAPSAPQAGRPRPSRNKPDIFSAHNKNSRKRAAKDLEADSDNDNKNAHTSSRSAAGLLQKHQDDIGAVDDSVLHRSRRKLQEKARVYKEMKRGEHVPSTGHNEEESLIDFDSRWGEAERAGRQPSLSSSSDDENDQDNSGGGEQVEYEDEYGRLRRGTIADAQRMERRKRSRLLGQEELDRMSARPVQPSNLIVGDVIQSEAFAPDGSTASAMASLAAKRDRSATPPPQRHYEADKEFRIKGVGFFSFSKDEQVREAEMRALKEERERTEKAREGRRGALERRRREIEERRQQVAGKRARRQADVFLEGLARDIGGEEKTEEETEKPAG